MKDKSKCIKKFNDSKAFEDGKILIDLIASIDDSVIDRKLVSDEDSPEQKKLNNLYGVSSARKLGANILYAPTDNGAQNARQMLLIASSLNQLE